MGKHERQAYLKAIKERYRKANRTGKARILDEFCAVCGYHRKDAVIVRSTIDLAYNLGLKGTAEGVETRRSGTRLVFSAATSRKAIGWADPCRQATWLQESGWSQKSRTMPQLQPAI